MGITKVRLTKADIIAAVRDENYGDSDLSNFANLSGSGLIERKSEGVIETVPVTDYIKTLLNDATAADARSTMGLGSMATASTSSYQPLGNELTAIQALSDTPGFLKKLGDGNYSIDNNNYLPLSGGTLPWSAVTGKPTTLNGYGITNGQPLGNELTALQALVDVTGFLKKTGDGSYSIDSNTYLPTSNEINKYISTFRKTGVTNPAINLEDGEISIPDYSSLGINPSVSPNTVAVLGTVGANIGGCSLSGFSNNSSEMALGLSGYSGKTTATENAVVMFNAAKHSGTTTVAALASNDIAFAFSNNNTTIVRIFGNGNINANGSITASSFSVGNNQVVSSRRTGWTAPTGTATRTTFATGTVTLSQLAERVKALIDDLTTHGLIGA